MLHYERSSSYFISLVIWGLKMNNDILVQIVGMRYVSLVTNNGIMLTLKYVRHALNIHLSLIFARKLNGDGFCITFSEG